MGDKKFTWLAGTCYPRRGPMLEKGKEYSVADYGESIVAYWVSEGAAKYLKEKKGESLKEE
jgi:hypothetical protein